MTNANNSIGTLTVSAANIPGYLMKKTFNFGKIDYDGRDKKLNAVTVEVNLKETKKGPVFSASGYIWNARKTDMVCGGQCLDLIAEFINDSTFKRIYCLWKVYHLNDMNAGTPEQTAAVEKLESTGWRYDYKEACEHLKTLGLYEVDLDGKPYKYGHSWIYRAIPDADLAEIRALLSE